MGATVCSLACLHRPGAPPSLLAANLRLPACPAARPHVPACSLILINEQIYGQLRQQIVASQMPDRQQHLAACLEKLMLVRGVGCWWAAFFLAARCQFMPMLGATGWAGWLSAGLLAALLPEGDGTEAHWARPSGPCL